MKSKVTIKPLVEPITLAELKAQLRITHSDEDARLNNLIVTARQMVEDYTGRKLINQTVTTYFDYWPCKRTDEDWDGIAYGPSYFIGSYCPLRLPNPPLQSVTEVSFIDDQNNETVYDSSSYYANNHDDDRYGEVVINRNSQIPSITPREFDSIKVEHVAGYGDDPTDVPWPLKQACLSVAVMLYGDEGCDCSAEMEHSVSSYKMMRIG